METNYVQEGIIKIFEGIKSDNEYAKKKLIEMHGENILIDQAFDLANMNIDKRIEKAKQ